MTPLPALFLLLPFLTQSTTAAQPPELAATVESSPSADFVGAWEATVVELDSRTRRDLDLTIRIENDSFLTVATRRELLAAGARKRVFLYAPGASFQRGIPARYRITDDRGAELAAGQVPGSNGTSSADGYQIGLFCRIPAAEDDFGIPTSVSGQGGQSVRCARLSPRTFPDRWIGLSSLDLVVLHDAPLDELTTDQGRALQDYVRQGGTVLLIPGPTVGWLAHPLLQSLAPIRTEAPRTVSSLPGFAAEFGAFRGNETFLATPILNGTPVIGDSSSTGGQALVRFRSGIGQAFVLGADLRRAPFDTWSGRRLWWSLVLSRCPRRSQEDLLPFPFAASAAQRDDLLLRMDRLINPYPSFGLILGLAVVFLGVVGPLNYAVLWKLRRTLLLVVTVPGISIVMVALIVMIGYVLKGTSTITHSARLLSTRSGLEVARETHLFSLFSPASRTYALTFEPGSYGPFDRWNQSDRRAERRRQEVTATMTVLNGPSMGIRDLGVGQWQSWDFETRAIRELGKGVQFSLDGRRLRIHNGSSRPIDRGVFVQTGPEHLVSPFPTIEPGKDFEAPVAAARSLVPDPLAFPEDTLGGALLRPWIEAVNAQIQAGGGGPSDRYLLCVLRNEGDPIGIDARVSGRSQSVTLLHVAEAK